VNYLKDRVLDAMSAHHSGDLDEARRIVVAILRCLVGYSPNKLSALRADIENDIKLHELGAVRCGMTRAEIIRELVYMTPGGSEFVDDPARCLAWIKERRESAARMLIEQQRASKQLREDLEAANAKIQKAEADLLWQRQRAGLEDYTCPACGSDSDEAEQCECGAKICGGCSERDSESCTLCKKCVEGALA
jgi:hypothetical protein